MCTQSAFNGRKILKLLGPKKFLLYIVCTVDKIEKGRISLFLGRYYTTNDPSIAGNKHQSGSTG
jgi:hypothetical protein